MEWNNIALEKSLSKVMENAKVIGDKFPHVSLDGKYNDEGPRFWTSGFWAGVLWLTYEETKDESIKELAIKLEENLDEPLDYFLTLHHDVGFMWIPSSLAHNRIEPNDKSRQRALKAASHLAGRFNIKGGFIRAWTDEVDPNSTGWAIIDCMMNLPLLFWASKELNDPRFKHIGVAHADTVLEHFLREDNTVPHIVSFDPETGEKIENLGGQGFGPNSAWARGQAWAIYGFAMVYRETGEMKYLTAAKNIANYFISHLPEDKVPYWDFRTPEEDKWVRDSSASACAASGLLEISNLIEDKTEKDFYYTKAKEILKGLYDNYADFSTEQQGIITKGTVNYSRNKHVNVPIIYGDFFFIEALMKLNNKKGLF